MLTLFKNNRFRESFQIAVISVGLLWIVHLLQIVTDFQWVYLGIFPREVFGIKGILTAPFIHSDVGHLASNSLPLFVCLLIIFYFYNRVAWQSVIWIYFLAGLSVWVLARQVYHVGASGVVYGLVAFIFWIGMFRRNPKSIALALIVAFYYGGMMYGVLPVQEGVSWESHLYGALAGVLVSFIYKNQLEPDEEKEKSPWDDEEEEGTFFLERDTFEKTREQKARKNEENDWWTSDQTWNS